MNTETKMTDAQVLDELLTGVRLDAHHDPLGEQKVAALERAIARLRGEGAPPEQQGGGDAVRQIIREMRERKVNHGKGSSPTLAAWADRLEAALAQDRASQGAEEVAVPEGMVLVPKKPTLEMCRAVLEETRFCSPVDIYRKMLAASPKPTAGEQQQGGAA